MVTAAAAAVVAKNARLFICYLPKHVLPNSAGLHSNSAGSDVADDTSAALNWIRTLKVLPTFKKFLAVDDFKFVFFVLVLHCLLKWD